MSWLIQPVLILHCPSTESKANRLKFPPSQTFLRLRVSCPSREKTVLMWGPPTPSCFLDTTSNLLSLLLGSGSHPCDSHTPVLEAPKRNAFETTGHGYAGVRLIIPNGSPLTSRQIKKFHHAVRKARLPAPSQAPSQHFLQNEDCRLGRWLTVGNVTAAQS